MLEGLLQPRVATQEGCEKIALSTVLRTQLAEDFLSDLVEEGGALFTETITDVVGEADTGAELLAAAAVAIAASTGDWLVELRPDVIQWFLSTAWSPSGQDLAVLEARLASATFDSCRESALAQSMLNRLIKIGDQAAGLPEVLLRREQGQTALGSPLQKDSRSLLFNLLSCLPVHGSAHACSEEDAIQVLADFLQSVEHPLGVALPGIQGRLKLKWAGLTNVLTDARVCALLFACASNPERHFCLFPAFLSEDGQASPIDLPQGLPLLVAAQVSTKCWGFAESQHELRTNSLSGGRLMRWHEWGYLRVLCEQGPSEWLGHFIGKEAEWATGRHGSFPASHHVLVRKTPSPKFVCAQGSELHRFRAAASTSGSR